jgi:hypothetical protein
MIVERKDDFELNLSSQQLVEQDMPIIVYYVLHKIQVKDNKLLNYIQ